MLISAAVHLVTLARTVNKTLTTAKDRLVKTTEHVLIKSMDTDVFVFKVLMAVTVRPTLTTANQASVQMEVGCLGLRCADFMYLRHLQSSLLQYP